MTNLFLDSGSAEARHRRWIAPAAIVVAAFLARVAFSASVVGLQTPPRDDAAQYDSVARSISHGGEFIVLPEGYRAHRAPAYPLFLAGVYRVFGVSWVAARMAQALIGACTCGLIYATGLLLVDRRLGLLAGFASALDPYSILWCGYLLSEPLCALFTTASTAALLRAREDARWTGFWAMACGLATLTRPNMAVLFPLGLIWLLGSRTRRVALCLVAIAAFVLTIAPWTVRNYRVLHRWVPITTIGGTVLWEANNPYLRSSPEARGHFLHAPDLPEAQKARGLSEVDLDAYNLRLALDYLGTHRSEIPGALVGKFLGLWNLFPETDSRLFRWIATGVMMLLVTLVSLGLWRAWRRREWRLMPVLIPIMTVTVTALIYFGDARIRAPAQPAALLVAAYGLVPARRGPSRS